MATVVQVPVDVIEQGQLFVRAGGKAQGADFAP
jgi:hypothetical protein